MYIREKQCAIIYPFLISRNPRMNCTSINEIRKISQPHIVTLIEKTIATDSQITDSNPEKKFL